MKTCVKMTSNMDELQRELTQYKMRCAGLDTVVSILKDSKHETVTLIRQNKALQTAVANLQNRLSTNGLLESCNIEETDMYTPRISEQTLDNLARENARIRSLLKNAAHQPAAKVSEQSSMDTTLVESLKASNSQLKDKLKKMEGIKLFLVEDYNKRLTSLKEEMAAERLKLQQEVEKYKNQVCELKKINDKWSDKDNIHPEQKTTKTQTVELHAETINNVKESLKSLQDQCRQFAEMEKMGIYVNRVVSDAATERPNLPTVPTDEYQKIVEKLQEVTLMNQRWQVHNDALERQHSEVIAELKNEIDMLRDETEVNKAEKMRMMQMIEDLQTCQRTQHDPSYIEILKEQIQLCTEDFNKERKEHEEALRKNKVLQEELNRYKAQLEQTQQELVSFKATSSPASELSRQPLPQQLWTSHYPTHPRPELNQQPLYPSPSPARFHNPGDARYPAPPQAQWTPPNRLYNAHPDPNQSNHMYGLNTLSTQHPMSFSQPSLGFAHPASAVAPGPTSMPAPRRYSEAGAFGDQGVISCFKCNKEFPDGQTNALLAHIDTCKYEKLLE